MTRMALDLVQAGLRVEYVPGWQTRGSSSFAPAGVVCHWTAGPRGTTGRPSLNVVTHGRAGIPGPLCNVYLARDGTCVIVAAGRANHAGTGGARGLVGNSAVYGIEAESAGNGDWTAAQRIAYPRLVAALLRGLNRPAAYAIGHNEWAPTRKIDIRDWDMTTMRAQVAAILAATDTEDDDMTPEQARRLDKMADQVQRLTDWAFGTGPTGPEHVAAMIGEIPIRTAQQVHETPVHRVEGEPTTFLQDTVDGSTAAMEARDALREVTEQNDTNA